MMKTRLSPITRAGLALTAALALASTAQAAPDLPAELPPFGKDKPLVVPKIISGMPMPSPKLNNDIAPSTASPVALM